MVQEQEKARAAGMRGEGRGDRAAEISRGRSGKALLIKMRSLDFILRAVDSVRSFREERDACYLISEDTALWTNDRRAEGAGNPVGRLL